MKSLTSINPSDGTLVWKGQTAGPAEIDHAFREARSALPSWSQRPTTERIEILRRFAEVLESHKEDLARTICREIGKPLPESLAEVTAMSGKVEISIEAHERRCSAFTGGPAITRFKPHGVLAVLGPYNFPGHLPNGHIVPALLAGNTILFKPSELAPATAELTREYWREAGLPGTVLHVLQGGVETARKVASHSGIDGLLFTGSAATGKLLARQFAETPGRILALEMGGNNPLIVDSGNISDTGNAVDLVIQSAFLSGGQRCTCARRLILVESESASDFIDTLVKRSAALTVGDPMADPPPFMGPLASPDFPQKVLEAQAALLEAGGVSLLKAGAGRPGTGFITPGIMDVTAVGELPDEEIFGPFLQLIRVANLDQAIEVANATRFGLASGIITDDETRYRAAYDRLRAGIINWNTQLTGASSAAPFGGIGDSGNLRPSAFLAADYCSYPVASIEKPVR